MKNRKITIIRLPSGYEIGEILDFGGEEYEQIPPTRAEEVKIDYERDGEREKIK